MGNLLRMPEREHSEGPDGYPSPHLKCIIVFSVYERL